MKQTKPPKQRNPLVALVCQRNGAGFHQKSGKARRQAGKREMRRIKEEAGFAQHMCCVH